MSDWFSTLAAGSELSMDAAAELQERGFIVLPGPVPSDLVERLANAYTRVTRSNKDLQPTAAGAIVRRCG